MLRLSPSISLICGSEKLYSKKKLDLLLGNIKTWPSSVLRINFLGAISHEDVVVKLHHDCLYLLELGNQAICYNLIFQVCGRKPVQDTQKPVKAKCCVIKLIVSSIIAFQLTYSSIATPSWIVMHCGLSRVKNHYLQAAIVGGILHTGKILRWTFS